MSWKREILIAASAASAIAACSSAGIDTRPVENRDEPLLYARAYIKAAELCRANYNAFKSLDEYVHTHSASSEKACRKAKSNLTTSFADFEFSTKDLIGFDAQKAQLKVRGQEAINNFGTMNGLMNTNANCIQMGAAGRVTGTSMLSMGVCADVARFQDQIYHVAYAEFKNHKQNVLATKAIFYIKANEMLLLLEEGAALLAEYKKTPTDELNQRLNYLLKTINETDEALQKMAADVPALDDAAQTIKVHADPQIETLKREKKQTDLPNASDKIMGQWPEVREGLPEVNEANLEPIKAELLKS